jgi:hypothetical protein
MTDEVVLAWKDIAGHVAMHAVKMSPDPVPKNLETVLAKFRERWQAVHPLLDIRFTSIKQMETALQNCLFEIPEFEEWNARETDFVEVEQLVRNVCITLFDEWFEKQKEAIVDAFWEEDDRGEYLYRSMHECLIAGEHCSDTDEDGFCNLCGHGPEAEDEDSDKFPCTIGECVSGGTHGKKLDEDGFCVYCGAGVGTL